MESIINDTKELLNALNEIIIKPINGSKRGRKLKHGLREYLKILIIIGLLYTFKTHK